MTQSEKYRYALQLLAELNCPKPIMDALDVWGFFVRSDEIKLHNWEALAGGGIVEGEAREIPDVYERLERLRREQETTPELVTRLIDCSEGLDDMSKGRAACTYEEPEREEP